MDIKVGDICIEEYKGKLMNGFEFNELVRVVQVLGESLVYNYLTGDREKTTNFHSPTNNPYVTFIKVDSELARILYED